MDIDTKKSRKQVDENIVQDAINETGFGKFNLKIVAICELIFLNVAFTVTSMGLILPAAACDFRMSTVDKGRLSAAPMLGMLCGSYFWGCYAAIKGRKKTLLVSLFLHGVADLLASVVPSYWVFVVLKFLSGAAMNGQLTVVFLYLGEFQPTKYRDKVLSWMEMAWVMGLLVVGGLGWIIIPLDVNLAVSGWTFHSWNLFVLICSLPALLIGTWLTCFPETPKYLAETGQHVKMLDILMRMYSENTGEPPKEYIAKIKSGTNSSLCELVNAISDTKATEETKERSLGRTMKDIFIQTATIVKPPYLSRTILICLISCFVTSAYYTLTLWLPELFRRYADFEERYPNRSASVCTLSFPTNATKEIIEDPFGCEATIQTSVFVHTFILGAACIPTGLALPLFVNYIGYKYFLVLATAIPGVVTACLFLVKTSVQNLILSCIFESITSVSISVVYCLIIDLYPTNLRAMASGLSAFVSRGGALSGNLLIGYLIDDHCILLIMIVAAQLFASAILALFTPGNCDSEKLEKPGTNDVKA